MELFKAHRQWAKRPSDERFQDLQSLYNQTKLYADQAREKLVPVSDIRTEAIEGDVQIVGKANQPARLTYWAFGQLAARVNAPANYLRELPATLACQNLNHGLANLADRTNTANLLFHTNGSLMLRAFTSDKYARIWNYEVAERLLELESRGWEPARPDIRREMGDFPALYASDHDMFAFVRNRASVIRETGNPDGLQRGVIVENSEVGASALKLTRFLYREMCGNHIIWGASEVVDITVRHVGSARQRWGIYEAKLQRYAESSTSDEEATIGRARTVRIGDTKEQVLDRLFGMRSLNLSRKTLDSGYDAAIPDQDGDPRTVWGMVQGLTRHSQTVPFADARTTIDRAAGRILEVTF